MILKDKDNKLIRIYFLICDYFKELQYYCDRFSNNNQPELSDAEIMTIYLYVMQHEGHTKIKHIHRFASEYLRSWFPKLRSYQAFNNRLNRLTGAFNRLVEMLLTSSIPDDCIIEQSVLVSMPIITCSGKRSGKVAPEVTDKGFCSTKGMYYHGMKLHMLEFRREGKLPHPEEILFTPASVNDITVYKQAWSSIENRTFFEDKIYMDQDLNQQMIKKMYTPIKGVKGTTNIIKKRLKAADDLYSIAVSRVRQPIEAIFNWLIEKVDIQRANKVRSTKGLMVHAFGRLSAAFITLVI
ncbi:MAG: transposase [Bacteroidales bacterium]|nr:transposase [Bacteroidales bacterium]MBN2817776.1 transposase [Bacteroidales bacterium]